MNELSRLILDKYQVRKTANQKTEFIELLQNEITELPVRVEQGGLFRSRNIVVGDLENCEVVLGAHYDTQPVLPFPNFLAPKNMWAYLGYCLLVFAGLFIVEMVFISIAMVITGNITRIMLFNYLMLAFIILWMFIGYANKHTANDNTSGVITLIEAMQDEEIRKKACFVFFDHEEVGLLGSANFAKKHKELLENKLVINFDCVSDGDYIMLVVGKNARDKEDVLKDSFVSSEDKTFVFEKSTNTLYPSDQINFKKNVGVAAFKKHKYIGYYMDRIHTPKDTIFEERNIEVIVEGLKKFVRA